MPIQRVKGMYDLVPDHTPTWQKLESGASRLLESYGYGEIRLPVLERSELFSRAIGLATDVVSKEMYSFTDRNDDLLSLRPEGTAGCIRAAIAGGLLKGHMAKLWYHGAMFRRENVQKGRNRQFYQTGAEVLGLPGPDIDAEMIIMLSRLWRELEISGLTLELNSLGTRESRQEYRALLVDYLNDHRGSLDDDSIRRLESNPLRILDSKNPAMAELIANAPSLLDSLDNASTDHFAELTAMLDEGGVGYQVNARLVRGLDYYSRTVFEFKTTELGSQGTVCAGGRYDGLVEMLDGPATPGIGFSMGVDRLVALVQQQGNECAVPAPHVYFVAAGDRAWQMALSLSERLRDTVPGLKLTQNLGSGSFRAQFKRADKSGAQLALVLGEQELADKTVQIKPLRTRGQAQVVSHDGLAKAIVSHLNDTAAIDNSPVA
ncbi:MAG: histidine--tRNA ligase [Lysobacterales bacterium]